MTKDLRDLIFNVTDQESFSHAALEIFRYQADYCQVYREYISALGKNPLNVENISDIPFLPVELFKTRKIIPENLQSEIVFESSRTTGSDPGRHYIHDLSLYERSFNNAFRLFYGAPSEYFIAALLPSYTERQNSSLVYMTDKLIKQGWNKGKGFYKGNLIDLVNDLNMAGKTGQKTMLIGVAFALLDLAEEFSPDLEGTIIMETGGMKGRRKEITRDELHRVLKKRFNVASIHSEYGMTELLSQAYSKGEGIYFSPPWMKILIRDPHDPFTIFREPGKTGGINIIDLANLYSCSFISTSDYGRLHPDGSFEVLGRFDNSDIRGCNLMADQELSGISIL